MEITYRQEGDYLLPNLYTPEPLPLGKYGRLRRSYLREYREEIYTGLQLSGKLETHLQETDRQAREMVERLTSQMARQQNVDERLKASDPLCWTGRMNNIKAAAEEIILRDLVYA